MITCLLWSKYWHKFEAQLTVSRFLLFFRSLRISASLFICCSTILLKSNLAIYSQIFFFTFWSAIERLNFCNISTLDGPGRLSISEKKSIRDTLIPATLFIHIQKFSTYPVYLGLFFGRTYGRYAAEVNLIKHMIY